MYYTLKDHQGNLAAVIHPDDEVERLSYDAWGRRRHPDGFGYGTADEPVEATFDRGFTLHKHYDGFGLINMNGRLYDPVMSSFLSPDNYVQSPNNSQNFNRYSYCLNNPLRLVDLDGNDVQVFEQKDKKTGMVTVTFFVTMRVENHSQASHEDINDRAVGIKQQIEDSFKGYDKKNNTQYETIVQFVGNSDEQFVLDFVNDVRGGSVFTAGKTDEIGNTIVNTLQVEIDGIPGKYNQTESETSRTGAHEFGHALGLRHGQDPQNELDFDADNLMNQSNKSSCTDITIEQMEAARKNVIKNMER